MNGVSGSAWSSGALSVEEEKQIWEWNQTLPETINSSIQALIEVHANAQPHATAISSNEENLTYSELWDLSSRLASFLVSQESISEEVIVPLFFEKSIWTIVSMLGVLKAGGAFVALDPSLPTSRLEYAVLQGGCRFALASTSKMDLGKDLVGKVFPVDKESIEKLPDPTSLPDVLPSTAAYIIFTSGSTGQPKGVLIEHQQLSTSSVHGGRALGFDSQTRMLQFASYAFDACILEIFTTLIRGGCICVPSEFERINDIGGVLDDLKVNCALFTPSLLSKLPAKSVAKLKTLILGGESLPADLVNTWASKLHLYLAYGPAECCVVCLISDTKKTSPRPGDLGHATSSRAWIVDTDGPHKLAKIGQIGELVVEGPIVGKGYLNDASKTEASFLQNPSWLSKKSNSRFYLTGDLVAYNSDGSIRFIGRKDTQVKVNGQRLELGEVEYHLQSCLSSAGIQEMVAELVVPKGENSSPSLATFFRIANQTQSVGYVNWEEGNPSTFAISVTEKEHLAQLATEVREKMSLVLPIYAIPSIFVPLKQTPLTVSGKVDRRKLRSIAADFTIGQLSGLATTASNDTPKSPMEQKLQYLWADVLAINAGTIGTKDNFLWLGGDSVYAIGLSAAARNQGLLLTVESILRNPVLSQMSLCILQLHEQETPNIIPFSLIGSAERKDLLVDAAGTQFGLDQTLIEDAYPCSHMQEGMLALSIKETGSYVMQLVYSLHPSIGLDKLESAWQKTASLNPIMRTQFFETPTADLYQAVLKMPLRWQISENSSLEEYLKKDKKSDMGIGKPLSWCTVLKEDGKPHHLIWTVHHSLMDAWSVGRIIKCVEDAYSGVFLNPTKGFNQFIRYISTRDLAISKDFWGSQLKDAPTPSFPELPYPTYRTFANSTLIQEVALKRKPRSSFTTATAVRAAWALLLGMHSNTFDVVSGVTLNGRTAEIAGIESILGPTLVTVPFRAQFQKEQPIEDLLSKIQSQYLDTIPFEQLSLQEIKRISVDIAAACQFRALLVVQAEEETVKNGSESPIFSTKPDVILSLNYGLTLECELHHGSITVKATFDDKVLGPAQVQRMLRQFEHLLGQVSSEKPGLLVSDALQICPADMKEIMTWNASVPEAYEACVHELICESVQKTADQPAVCSWDDNLTYGELWNLASRLARYLSDNNIIKTETLVPICFEKSKWAIVTMLAVLIAGGAFVPLNPTHPIERLKTIIEDLGDSGAEVVIASASSSKLFQNIKPSVVVSEPLFEELPVAQTKLQKSAEPHNSAIVIYTSGSTGKPKGIVLEHGTLCTSFRAHSAIYKLGPTSRVLNFAAFTFDISYDDILNTLLNGGCVCVPSEGQRMNDLSGAINSMDVNHINVTKSVAMTLNPSEVKVLKVLASGGEAMTKELVEKWAEHVTLVNVYGPSETSVYSIGQPNIKRDDDPSIIGRGMGTRTWITDPEDANKLLPIGATGELLIEGPLVARGYLGDPELTKAAFINEPSWMSSIKNDSKPSRLYRTGDLARYGSDGIIHFVGRQDSQLKLRGQRIELGEIEYQLRNCLSRPVQAVVLSIVPKDGQETLAAFLQVEIAVNGANKAGENLDILATSSSDTEEFSSFVDAIENRLASLLPPYMVPSLYIPVYNIPLNDNRKIDRRRLKEAISGLSFAQLSGYRGTSTKVVPPSTVMEQRMLELWKALLNTPNEISIDSDFFRLGGDSITAMKLVAAARQQKLSLSVDQIFKYPTLQEMALIAGEFLEDSSDLLPFSLLDKTEKDEVLDAACRHCNLSKEQIEDIYPCIPNQVYWINAGMQLHEHQAQSVYKMPLTLDLDRFVAAWESVHTSHPILRTRIIKTAKGDYFNVVTKTNLEWRRETSLESFLNEDRKSIMGFGDPLQRWCIVDDEHLKGRYFIHTMQHSTYDAWSLSLLYKDRDHAYHHGPSSFAVPNFNRFVKPLTQAYKHAAAEFWQQHLAGTDSKPLFVMPDTEGYSDTPYPQGFPDTKLSRKIQLSSSQGSRITISTICEVAWALVFARYLGTKDIVIDILRSGRTAHVVGVEDMTYATTVAVPFRIPITPNEPMHSLLSRIQQQFSDITVFEQLGFDNIVKLDPEIGRVCKNSIRINIAPRVGTDEGRAPPIDMPLIWAELAYSSPFRVDVIITNYGIYCEINFDQACISIETVDMLLRQFELAMKQISESEGEAKKKVGDIDLSGAGTLKNESAFEESADARSAHVKKLMLSPPDQRAALELPDMPSTGSFIIGTWGTKRVKPGTAVIR